MSMSIILTGYDKIQVSGYISFVGFFVVCLFFGRSVSKIRSNVVKNNVLLRSDNANAGEFAAFI